MIMFKKGSKYQKLMNIQARGMNGTSRWGCYRLLPSQGLRETTVWIGVVRDFCAFRLNAPLFFYTYFIDWNDRVTEGKGGGGEKERSSNFWFTLHGPG